MILVPTYASWNICYSLAWIELSFRSVGRNKKTPKLFYRSFFSERKQKLHTSLVRKLFKTTYNILANCLVENPTANASTTG